MKFFLFILFLASIFLSKVAVSQSDVTSHSIKIEIPRVALLGLLSEDSKEINYEVDNPNTAGNSIRYEKVKNKIWLNYSSIIRSKNQKRKIVASIKDALPSGFSLKLSTHKTANSGTGELGVPANEVTLSNVPSDIITGIGSCYTGKGTNKGYLLKYTLEFDKSSANYALLSSKSFQLNILYTLTDDN